MSTELIMVDTPQGEGRLHVDRAGGASPFARTIVLGHGAGGGVNAMDLSALADTLPALGISVIRFEQPWRVAGRKVAVLAPRLDEAWIAALVRLRAALQPTTLIFGGRSAGARVACRTADDHGAAAVVCLAFPLHPPGRPGRSRLPELITPTVPVLVVQGARDAFGAAELVRDQTRTAVNVTVVTVPGADHSMKVASSTTVGNDPGPVGVRRLVVGAVAEHCGR